MLDLASALHHLHSSSPQVGGCASRIVHSFLVLPAVARLGSPILHGATRSPQVRGFMQHARCTAINCCCGLWLLGDSLHGRTPAPNTPHGPSSRGSVRCIFAAKSVVCHLPMQVIHRDVKLENLLLFPAASSSGEAKPPAAATLSCKLTDFGLHQVRVSDSSYVAVK